MLAFLSFVVVFTSIFVANFLWLGTFWPRAHETLAVRQTPTSRRSAEAPNSKVPPLRILVWNVQFFAGKKRIFFYDVPEGAGPDTVTIPEEVDATLEGIARVIRARQPDVVLLQEVDQGAHRTQQRDQVAELLEKIESDGYRYTADTFYWRAAFVPHPKVMGSVGMKLVTLSKVPLEPVAYRHALAEMPHSWLIRRFQLKRAVLETRVSEGAWKGLRIFNTHLDAFAQGFDTMEKQVNQVKTLVEQADREGAPWLIAGDFNLLMQGLRDRIHATHQMMYAPQSEITPLTEKFPSFPSKDQVNGNDRAKYFSYHPNDPTLASAGPDRTIDYLFHSRRLQIRHAEVLQKEADGLSDHLPLWVELSLSD